MNGQKLGSHAVGYSTFRVALPVLHSGENLLVVRVSNEKNRTVYPQKADFTFYGGLYRDVYLLTVPTAHFALNRHGSSALQVTAALNEDFTRADISAEAWVSGPAQTVTFTLGAEEKTVPVDDHGYAAARFTLENPHLWNGVDDPYLYTMRAELPESGDMVETTFGCRSFSIDPEKGFILNGRSYRLCGGARHQDRQGLGSALTRKEHEEDMTLLLEMGCNSVRLAHYQHDAYFYDLCDKYGLVAWAEIPYITEHMPEARENTVQQMTELILQNYNHPSIVCWGLSNEITAAGGVNNDMVENHRILNDLCHKLDPTRLTTMAHAFMLDIDDPFVRLPDVCGYNLYFGWYLGELQQNEKFLDEFHRKYPQMPVALSEFGADANPAFQNGNPQRGDWSESYQAVYHEHMMQMWQERPYLWALYIWNTFDFAADGRNEGGKPGQNQKGLVTFDRKTKKDAFYLYKAYLSKEPFVHLCGRRYVDRTERETEIKVYSNQPEVTLLVDGKAAATQTGDKIFRFTVPISGERSPVFDAKARGVFFGMNTMHKKEHFARAVLEGTGCGLAQILSAFRERVPIESLRIIGGGAKSKLWKQIIADLCDVRLLEVSTFSDSATSMGAAAAVGVGIGLYPDLAAAVAHIQTGAATVPEQHAAYEMTQKRYDMLYPSLVDVFHL